jgi:hypothetical protein
VYPDPGHGAVPLGLRYGSTRDKDGNPFKPGGRVTREEAEGLLVRDMKGEVSGACFCRPWETLDARQQAALMSWAYNIGGRGGFVVHAGPAACGGRRSAVVIREELPRLEQGRRACDARSGTYAGNRGFRLPRVPDSQQVE